MTSVTCSVNNNQHFQQPAGNTLFTATISDSNAAFLDDTTVPLAEYASAATTLPLDLDLWHRRLAHHHLQDVTKLWKKKLVTGMTLLRADRKDGQTGDWTQDLPELHQVL